ncbi:MAG: hypothetical protein ACUVWJ_04155 [Spirochaetota bacterium]
MKKIPYCFLMVDGMKVHLHGARGIYMGMREMRWALASRGPKQPFEPVGFSVNREWDEIRKELEERLNDEKLEVLFADGGPGTEQNLLAEGMRYQRYLWHVKQDFPFILYAEGLKKAEQKPFSSLFDEIPLFEMTKKRLDKIDPADKKTVQELAQKTKEGFEQLLNALDVRKYPRDKTYL